MPAPRTFAQVSHVERIESTDSAARFAAQLDPEWTIGGKPNGGYLLALLARAAVELSAQPHPIAASAHYLRAPEPGPVDVHAELLRAGRSASQVRVGLRQDGARCVEALITVGRLDPTTAPYWSAGVPAFPVGAYESAIRVPAAAPNGLRVAIMDQVDLRLDPGAAAFGHGRPSGRGVLTGWLALAEDEPFDPVSLLYAIDAFPPATFDIEYSGWVPTLELTGYVRALPAPGPVRVVQKAQLIDAQRVDEQCWIVDSAGRLVATGTQLAGVRLG